MSVGHDARFALRSLLRNRVYAAATISTLALGVASVTVVYAIVHALLLAAPRYADPDRIAVLRALSTTSGDELPLSVAEYIDIRRALVPRVFSELALFRRVEGNLTGADEPDRITSQGVTGEFFHVLGVRPAIGRTFAPSEEVPGVANAVVISHSLWMRRFSGERAVVGRRLRLDEDEYVVAGVMPPEFEHPGATRADRVELWFLAGFRGTPFRPPNRRVREASNHVIGRLAPGVSIAAAEREVSHIGDRVIAENPADYGQASGLRFSAVALHDQFLPAGARRGLASLLIAVSFVLLIAAANVAGLQVMRGIERAGELSVRRALGASRTRLVRQLLVESAVVGTISAIAGVAFGALVLRLILPALPERLPLAAIGVNAPVLLTTVVVAIGLAVAFGTLPAAAATQSQDARVVRSGGRASMSNRSRSALVTIEVALAVMLLTGSALLFRSFTELQRVRPGFDSRRLLTFRLAVPFPNDPLLGAYVTPSARVQYFSGLLRELNQLSGVKGSAIVGTIPFSGAAPVRAVVSIDGDAATADVGGRSVEGIVVSPGYFGVMGIPVLQGRDFAATDSGRAAGVAVINRTLARALWPAESPLGKRVKVGTAASEAPWLTVVGVAADVQTQSLDRAASPQIYRAFQQITPLSVGMVVRAEGDPRALAKPAAAVIRHVNDDQPIFAVHTMEDLMHAEVAARQQAAYAVVAFAALSLFLAGVGLYGLVEFAVSSRSKELGIRLALGLLPGQLTALVFRDAALLAGQGVVAGLIVAAMLSRYLTASLYGVGTHDWVSFVASPAAVMAVVCAAAWIPARRAATVDPLLALRR